MSQLLEGGCFCGQVVYTLEGPTDFAGFCHCQSCRRASGAPLLAWTSVPEHRFRLLSGFEVLRSYSRSGEVTWDFCGHCGTTLFYRSPSASEKVYVTIASLTSPLDRPLESHVSFEEKPLWVDLSPNLPRYIGKSDEPC